MTKLTSNLDRQVWKIADAMSPLSREQTKRWNEDGVLVVQKLFSPAEIEYALSAVFMHFKAFAPEAAAFDCDSEPHLSDAFHAAMINLRKTEPKTFSKIYDTMQTNAVISGLVTDRRVISIIGDLFGDPPETIARSDTLMRMDPPFDKRNLVGWHQDRTGRPQNDDGMNGIVFLLPLQDTTVENGAIQMCLGSHKEGFIDIGTEPGQEQDASRVYSLPDEKLANYEPADLSATAGDGIFLSFNLFHCSGLNVGTRIRFTAGARYNRAIADDFHPGILVYTPRS